MSLFAVAGIESVADKMTKTTSRKLSNDVNRKIGLYHATKTMPLHFEFGAYQRYRYKKRDPVYTRRKKRHKGHQKPNVYHGDMRRVILADGRARVRATYAGWTMRARGSRRHPMWGQSKKELEQRSASEEKKYVEMFATWFTRLAGTKKYKFRKFKHIRKRGS